jgi:hypothetical protein
MTEKVTGCTPANVSDGTIAFCKHDHLRSAVPLWSRWASGLDSDGHGLFVNPAPPDPGSMTGHKLPVAERTVSAGRYPDIIEQGGLSAAFTQLTHCGNSFVLFCIVRFLPICGGRIKEGDTWTSA